jgi:hypothetical protein
MVPRIDPDGDMGSAGQLERVDAIGARREVKAVAELVGEASRNTIVGRFDGDAVQSSEVLDLEAAALVPHLAEVPHFSPVQKERNAG